MRCDKNLELNQNCENKSAAFQNGLPRRCFVRKNFHIPRKTLNLNEFPLFQFIYKYFRPDNISRFTEF